MHANNSEASSINFIYNFDRNYHLMRNNFSLAIHYNSQSKTLKWKNPKSKHTQEHSLVSSRASIYQ